MKELEFREVDCTTGRICKATRRPADVACRSCEGFHDLLHLATSRMALERGTTKVKAEAK